MNNDQNLPQEEIDYLKTLLNNRQFSYASKKAKTLTKHYPMSFVLWNLLGVSFYESKKFNDAIESYKKAVSINPKFVHAHNNLAITLGVQGKLNKAIDTCKKAVLIEPNNALGYNNLGYLYTKLRKFDDAITAFKKALLIQPNYVEVYNNLGVALREIGKYEESISAYKKAISLQEDYADPYNNLGAILREQGKLDEAIESFDKALLLKPNYKEAYYNLSFPYNLKGNLQKGLELYEWRLKKDGFPTRMPRKHLIWDGKDSILDKKFFVYEEQGLGDTIQFCRYLSILNQKGAKVIFKVKSKMHALLKTLNNNIIFSDSEPDANSIDFEAPLMSLPYLFNTTLKSIPSMTSYLSTDHNRIISWKKYLDKDSFKVGICWQGSNAEIDFGRSFPLTLFKDISQLPNVELISLHKGEGEKQIEDIDFDLTILGNDFDNGEDAFVDTAAVMLYSDLIITSDTSIAHLAGALGCPTWVVLKKVPDWRWMLDRNDSPWYPSMKLYRQKEQDNWEQVFEIIKKDLQSFIKLKEN